MLRWEGEDDNKESGLSWWRQNYQRRKEDTFDGSDAEKRGRLPGRAFARLGKIGNPNDLDFPLYPGMQLSLASIY